ncbi:hypothetical protein ACFXGA_20265, partial [Actinosynnema sp. NPDC059335]|uniref:hypothetical protein n=1 Tax=Actinosynnema sp. NPDC059335 TaxID=3346804 RepID=UPI00366C4C3F
DRGAGVVLARRAAHRVGLLFPGQAAPVRARRAAGSPGRAVPARPAGGGRPVRTGPGSAAGSDHVVWTVA